MNKTLQAVWKFVDERFQVQSILKFAQKKTVPEHGQSFWSSVP
jgi:hypothetical protein